MNIIWRGSLVLLVAFGLIACGGGNEKGNENSDGSGSGSGEKKESKSGSSGSSGYSKSQFVGGWKVDPANLEPQIDKLIQEQLAGMPEDEREMAAGMVGMMKPMMLQMLGGIEMVLNEDGSATLRVPGENSEMETLNGEWTFEGGKLRIGMPDDESADGELEWVEASIESATKIKVTPPPSEDGTTFDLTMIKN